ncbi:ATP-binding protein [Hornefia butyriciproducens]|uniref:ATP-binding protein n=1 Tax=Hornefia butyriciproducens TaxID=2652293 RepID=UPI002A917B12|nr:ATP-binding protein [Hornefia butyriciproducens]MCI7413326.1 ATP-binding protein [Clostridiales bacterium]MDY6211071.1 ATP-binding protein [Hornefia butyriciproducens]
MYSLISKLIIYRNIGSDSILFRLADICRRFKAGEYAREELTSEILEQINRLLEVSTRYGFNKNLWHNYLAYLLAMTVTPFTLVSEKVGANDGSVNEFAKNDFAVFKQLFDYDFSAMEKELGIRCFSIIENYRAVVKSSQIFNRNVSEKVQELSESIERTADPEELYRVVTDFYRRYGVGKFGLNKAFRVNEDPEGELLLPITSTSDVRLEDLVGYEIQKQRLVENTEAFLKGRAANNVLLYGDAGTGKSTSIKAILNRYYADGLRMIEVYKHQFKDLSRIVTEIRNRNYRFIIYMDDLSFEEFETEYKYLKAVIEGGVEPYPENVLIYATSNRRHLIRETWKDRYDESKEDMHRNDTVQEKLSLANRFGCQIGYFAPTPKEYEIIVKELARRYPQIQIDEEELLIQAKAWEIRHGGFSGRTAQQFINYLAGTLCAE